MKFGLLVFLMVLGWISPLNAAQLQTLSVELVPVRKAYHVGEPVLFVMEVKNSQGDVEVDANERLPFRFVAEDEKQRRILPKAPDEPASVGYIVAIEKLAADQVYREVVVLNRHVIFDKPGWYVVPYHIEVHGFNTGVNFYSSKRQEVEVMIEAGEADAGWIREMEGKFRKTWGGGWKPPVNRAFVKNKEGAYVLDDMGQLQWGEVMLGVDSELVDHVLVEAMGRMTGWDFQLQVMGRMGDKVAKDKKLREKYLESLKGCQPCLIDAGLGMLRRKGCEVPDAWVREVFNAQAFQGTSAMIYYLAQYGSKKDIALLESLPERKKKELGESAARAIAAIRAREK